MFTLDSGSGHMCIKWEVTHVCSQLRSSLAFLVRARNKPTVIVLLVITLKRFDPSRIEIEDSEAVGISNIISNMITMFPRSTLMALPTDLFTSFINCLTLLTCSFGRSAALEEVVSHTAPKSLRPSSRGAEFWSFTYGSASLSAGQGRHGLHGGLRQAPGVLADAHPGRRAFPPRLFCPARHPGLQLLHPVSLGCSRRNQKPGEPFSARALTPARGCSF